MTALWEQIVAFDNLYAAYRKARRGKSARPDVAGFALRLEFELTSLAKELRNLSWQPGPYRLMRIYERKPRTISIAPFRDRVVHHAVMNIVEPILNRAMIGDSYACRKGKGVHAAISRYQALASSSAYVMKLDIRQYFPSIDHAILKNQLRYRIEEEGQVMGLLERIIDSSETDTSNVEWFPGDDLIDPLLRRRGLPIGNLTSQVFANWYLNEIDHWLQNDHRLRGYIRYVDDMTLFADAKPDLWAIRNELDARLSEQLRLRLHKRKMQLCPTRCKVDFLGYQLSRQRRWLRNDNGHRAARRLRKMATEYRDGKIGLDDVKPSVHAWIGHASHGETDGLRGRIFSNIVFSRAHA